MGKQKKNIEIEIRLCLKDPRPLARWLKNNATLLKACEQTDIYFDPPDKSFIFINDQGLKDADEWLRVRISDSETSVCYKKWHRNKKTGVSLYADEIEISASDSRKLISILKRLGFRETAVVKKHRESWRYEDFEFDCDQVQKLGYFVEIEYKGKVNNPKREREKIFLLLKKIGIKDLKIIDRGYPWMLWNPGKW
jgi:predicted adenylyl cyclase CyaB